ncbi:LysR family transcriptional regulator [Vibrio coralliilyticus]|uniref:LysR family transcriptional regulator n=1 Tax=Vibrio coralliilyticus TaxID=190893 RepID=UPI000BAC1AF3|nr:LysR family transcriptional regulator [Vibrio coralliilyticus]NOI75680.1 LysR family transcriptional regulator [Vibrio coralliilyticus]PAW04494.1 LysR family transcriptional regulator [Vibrio coralliilyticus]
MNAQGLDWNDIPFVLAVCETGSLSAASRKLGVNHSTVFRRIEGVELKLGVRLFERLQTGYVMTAEGEKFFQYAQELKEGVDRIHRELGGQNSRLEGQLTITTTDSLMYTLVDIFRGFQYAYPDVELCILTGAKNLDLVQREADIALRPTRNPPEHWVGRKLSEISYATYASHNYIETMADDKPENFRWLRLIDNLNQSSMNKIVHQLKHADAPVTISNSLMGVHEFAVAGFGIAALPRYLCESNPNLHSIHRNLSQYGTELWLLAHPDMRRSAKVHAFFEYVTPLIREKFAQL